MEELQCKVCTTQNVFENLVALGLEKDEAFHTAVALLLEEVIEQAVEDGYEAGYEVGYKEACGDLAEIVGAYNQSVNEEA